MTSEKSKIKKVALLVLGAMVVVWGVILYQLFSG